MFNLDAIPPHRSRDESRPPCVGRQEAAVPAAGADIVGLFGGQTAKDCAGGGASVQGLRPLAFILRISLVTGRSGPGPGGRLPYTQAGGLCRRPGAWGLPSVVPSKPVRGPRARPPPGPALQSLRSFRVLGGLETQSREPASGSVGNGNVGGPIDRPAFETLNHQGLLGDLRPKVGA